MGRRKQPVDPASTRPGGHPHDWYCNSRKKPERGGGLCNLRAGQGTDHVGAGHCKFHLGDTPTHAAAAHEQLAHANFRAWLEERGAPTGDPITTLTRILAETTAWYDYCRELVADLTARDWESKGRDGAVQLSAYVGLLERAQERTHKMLVDFVRLGLEERMARVTERQSEAIIRVIAGVVDELIGALVATTADVAPGLDAALAELAGDAVPRHLALVAGVELAPA